jgi:paraquat-inducible protein B
VGSPVYYRGMEVGQVVGYDFDEAAEAVNIRIFVNAPYHEKVRKNTRFWNASGIDLQVDADGVNISTQSVVSILLGGVAFDVPKYLKPAEEAPDGQLFHLYESRKAIEERPYRVKHYYLMYFDQNVRGLATDAPVEIRGIKIGEVLDVKLEVDVYKVTARVAVLVVIEPERIHSLVEGSDSFGAAGADVEESMERMIAAMVEQGLRGQLKTSNLLTGQLYVDLAFHPTAEPASVTQVNGYQVLPTLPAPFEQIAQRVNNILQKVEKMPLEEIGNELVKAIKALQTTLEAATTVAGGIKEDTIPGLKAALDEFQNVMARIEQTLGPDSALNHNVTNVMDEMSTTIRSLRALIDYLEQNPQSLIFGKENE